MEVGEIEGLEVGVVEVGKCLGVGVVELGEIVGLREGVVVIGGRGVVVEVGVEVVEVGVEDARPSWLMSASEVVSAALPPVLPARPAVLVVPASVDEISLEIIKILFHFMSEINNHKKIILGVYSVLYI